MYVLSKELQEYKGFNDRPVDFLEFWKKQLKLVKNHNPKVKIVKATFQYENVECYDIYFKGVDNSTIHAKYLKPTINKKEKVIMQFHGYMYHCGSWTEKLVYTSQGYSVVAMDCRGQGGLSEDLVQFKGCTVYGHVIKGLDEGPDNLYYKYVYLDMVTLSKIIIELEKIDTLYTMGLSQGGGLALVCAALVPEVEKVAVQNPFLSDFEKTLELCAGREQYRLIDYFRLFDPMHIRRKEVFETLAYIDASNFASFIKAEVLFGTGLIDDICPIETQMAIYNNIINSKKKLNIYPNFGHEDMPGFWDEALMLFNN